MTPPPIRIILLLLRRIPVPGGVHTVVQIDPEAERRPYAYANSAGNFMMTVVNLETGEILSQFSASEGIGCAPTLALLRLQLARTRGSSSATRGAGASTMSHGRRGSESWTSPSRGTRSRSERSITTSSRNGLRAAHARSMPSGDQGLPGGRAGVPGPAA